MFGQIFLCGLEGGKGSPFFQQKLFGTHWPYISKVSFFCMGSKLEKSFAFRQFPKEIEITNE